MYLKPEFIPPYAPRLSMRNVPTELAPSASSIERNLHDMRSAAAALIAAISLFEFCGMQERMLRATQAPMGRTLYTDWMFLAGREGAMAIRNFRFALSTVRGLIGTIPPWRTSVDTAALKRAEQEFSKHFPFADHMRHAIAHPENHSNPAKSKPITKGIDMLGMNVSAGAAVTIKNGIFNSTFSDTFEGALVHYDLTPETMKTILSILTICFDAFSNIDEFRFMQNIRP